MCGLVAVFDRSGRPVDDGLVFRMRDTIVHRGPNSAGTFVDNIAAIGMRRLSII